MDEIEKFLRETFNFGMKKASKKSGVPYSTIQQWCSYKSRPTLENAQKVANSMGLKFVLVSKD